MAKDKILHFIDGFRPCREFFLTGYCYWFALILIIRFGGGALMYDAVANHFTARIENELYDAQGIVSDLYPDSVEWNEYRHRDPAHAARIKADCITKDR